MKKCFGLLLTLLAFVVPVVSAQTTFTGAPPMPPVESWGTASLTRLSVPAQGFQGIDSTVTYAYSISPFGIYRTGGTNWFFAPLNLPNGAHVEEITVEYCDNSATGELAYHFTYNSLAGVSENVLFESGYAAVPGCQAVTTPVDFTVDNNAAGYMGEVFISEPGSNIIFVRYVVGYRLQVSPAPMSATFADVPTGHPFFKFVEALAASGISAGCGGGNFCPNNPVTRGQMAVFLASALGLHWPN